MKGLVSAAAGTFGADQLTKLVVLCAVELGTSRSLAGSVIRISFVRNRGMAWGLLDAYPALLACIAAVVLLLLGWHLWRHGVPGGMRGVALGFLAGGVAGNLLDRLLHHGYVTDFIDVGVGAHRWPTFNLADGALVAGVALLVWSMFRGGGSGGE